MHDDEDDGPVATVREVGSALAMARKQKPSLSPLMREAFRSLWSEAQCEAAARNVDGAQVRRQARAWLVALQKAGAGAPYSPARLAWLAELTDALEGHATPELEQRRAAHASAVKDVERLRARLASRLVLLVGGDEKRRAALAIASPSAGALVELLNQWRSDARLRVLADELQLDDGLRAEVQLALAALQQPEPKSPSLTALTGRLLRELQAVQEAFSAAGVKAPTLKLKR